MDRIKLNITVCLLFLTLALQLPASAQDWPMFRANIRRTGNAADIAAGADLAGRKDWTVKIPDAVRSMHRNQVAAPGRTAKPASVRPRASRSRPAAHAARCGAN